MFYAYNDVKPGLNNINEKKSIDITAVPLGQARFIRWRNWVARWKISWIPDLSVPIWRVKACCNKRKNGVDVDVSCWGITEARGANWSGIDSCGHHAHNVVNIAVRFHD